MMPNIVFNNVTTTTIIPVIISACSDCGLVIASMKPSIPLAHEPVKIFTKGAISSKPNTI
ncbi:hypothetical protein D3C72_2582680 [compost metagenome]